MLTIMFVVIFVAVTVYVLWNLAKRATKHAAPKPIRTRRIFDASAAKQMNAPVYWRFDMKPGATIKGPAIIAEHETSTVVGSRFKAEINSLGQIVMELVK